MNVIQDFAAFIAVAIAQEKMRCELDCIRFRRTYAGIPQLETLVDSRRKITALRIQNLEIELDELHRNLVTMALLAPIGY